MTTAPPTSEAEAETPQTLEDLEQKLKESREHGTEELGLEKKLEAETPQTLKDLEQKLKKESGEHGAEGNTLEELELLKKLEETNHAGLAEQEASKDVNRNCSMNSEDCRKTGCCRDIDRSCWRKDDYWAACKVECDPNTPDEKDGVNWSCEKLEHGGQKLPEHMYELAKVADRSTCTDKSEDCRESRCCKDASMVCFEKNEKWASCQLECLPGKHAADPKKYRTEWSCSVLLPNGKKKLYSQYAKADEGQEGSRAAEAAEAAEEDTEETSRGVEEAADSSVEDTKDVTEDARVAAAADEDAAAVEGGSEEATGIADQAGSAVTKEHIEPAEEVIEDASAEEDSKAVTKDYEVATKEVVEDISSTAAQDKTSDTDETGLAEDSAEDVAGDDKVTTEEAAHSSEVREDLVSSAEEETKDMMEDADVAPKETPGDTSDGSTGAEETTRLAEEATEDVVRSIAGSNKDGETTEKAIESASDGVTEENAQEAEAM